MKEKTARKLLNTLRKRKNFMGFSRELLPVIRKGKEMDRTGIRVYVRKKEPLTVLRTQDVIPDCIDGVETDVVEIGEVRALAVDKKREFEEIPLGVSVGHYNITAGSLGLLCAKDGVGYAASAAHVLTPDASMNPEEVREKRICQPGVYHQKPCRACGEYYWHKRIMPMGEAPCPITKAILGVLNKAANMVGSRTRFYADFEAFNYIDFGVYKPFLKHINKYADDSLDPSWPIVGLLFAGSEQVGIICKAKYFLEEGFAFPAEVSEPKLGDKVGGCSFWCNCRTEVVDPSAVIQVGYRSFNALFFDVVMVKNKENEIKGGWSGSSFRLIVEE